MKNVTKSPNIVKIVVKTLISLVTDYIIYNRIGSFILQSINTKLILLEYPFQDGMKQTSFRRCNQ